MSYYIGARCSCCHYCYHECPVKAIEFAGTSYEINDSVCIGCGRCAEVCPSGIIYDPEAMSASEAHAPIELNSDLVVIGGGGSGLVAAVRAAQLGHSVIVIEKAKKCGGNTNLGHGFMLRYSKWHEKAGLSDVRRQFIDTLYEDTGKVLDYSLLTSATYALSDMFDWLCEFGGADENFTLRILKDAPPDQALRVLTGMIDMPKRISNTKCTESSMGPGWMGTYVVEKMLVAAKGLGIKIITGCTAKELIVGTDNTFSGVRAEDSGGEVIVFSRACIIASGGFSHNDDIVEKCNPSFFSGQPVKRLSVASSTGDGISMVDNIGGMTDLINVRAPAGGPVHHPWSSAVMDLTGYCNPSVDKRGNFLDLVNIIPGLPTCMIDELEGCVVYQILDADGVEANIKSRFDRNPEEAEKKDFKSELEREAKLGIPVRKAWTLEQLAEKIGAKPSVLIESISDYNKQVDKLGTVDNLQNGAIMMGGNRRNKVLRPPFYAICQGRFSESASGGIVTDSQLRVRKDEDTVFDGLFAVGDSARGLFLKDDSGGKFGEMPWAMASGFMAGRIASDYIDGRVENS